MGFTMKGFSPLKSDCAGGQCSTDSRKNKIKLEFDFNKDGKVSSNDLDVIRRADQARWKKGGSQYELMAKYLKPYAEEATPEENIRNIRTQKQELLMKIRDLKKSLRNTQWNSTQANKIKQDIKNTEDILYSL